MFFTTKQEITSLLGVLSLLSTPVIAQQCNDNMQASTANGRFSINNNASITDEQTGLIWKRCLEGQAGTDCDTNSANSMTWQQALQQAENSNFANVNDWRLPNIKELSSIVELRCVDPSINLSVFPNQPSSSVWSGSPDAADSNYAWGVYFDNGDDDYSNRSSSRLVRLVRGGQ